MQTLNLFMMTVAPLLLLSCGHVKINDYEFCSPVPCYTDPATNEQVCLGATCDNFLSANQQILTEAEWSGLVQSWIAAGTPPECTTSSAIGNIKAEIEKLCGGKFKCDYPTQKLLTDGLEKISLLGKKPLP